VKKAGIERLVSRYFPLMFQFLGYRNLQQHEERQPEG
jgi:hypothetical protein